mgnify:CR=1 FL=1
MKRLFRPAVAFAALSLALSACSADQPAPLASTPPPADVSKAKNVILFIGDGMGISTVTAARIYAGQANGTPGEENLLSFEHFPNVALVKTYNTNAQTPDSAGTATAAHSGVKTKAGVIGVDETDDLAVIRYSGPVAAIGQFRKPLNLAVGDRIAVIGHPLHGLIAIKPIFVTGTVRDTGTAGQLRRWGRFAVNADIRRGNSGGPVIDAAGYVVGVVSAKINTPEMFKRTGTVMRNVGLIIRQDRVLRFLERFDIPYGTGGDRLPLDDEALAGIAGAFVARIGCWK